MDEQTVQQLLFILEHMEINLQSVTHVRGNWFPTHIGKSHSVEEPCEMHSLIHGSEDESGG